MVLPLAIVVSLSRPSLFPACPLKHCPHHTHLFLYSGDILCMSAPSHVPHGAQEMPPPAFRKAEDKFVQKDKAKPPGTVVRDLDWREMMEA